MDITGHRYNIAHNGFTVIEDIYTDAEVITLESTDKTGRVVHIEFSRTELPVSIDWAEKG